MPAAALYSLVKRILHFLFPRTCFACGCDLPWDACVFLCDSCEKGLKAAGPLICQRCGVTLTSGGAHCYNCRGSKVKTYKCSLIRSSFAFNASSRGLIHALKYSGADYLAQEMGKRMAVNFCKYPELAAAEIVMPVPLFPSRRRKRGYNQSALLARAFTKEMGLCVDEISLVRTRNTRSQTKLGRKDRLENMTGAFLCRHPNNVKGKVILLLDDVATTGATLEGCAAALKAAGAKKVFAYTFARE
ncbi:MAG: ComF family protein [Candidatus Avelusimicrobium sp.]|uniref:ComF family protein n=1 Tax=Candidatus Avelusimicrobium sp. TaxID=3048833 RepID=UPI003F0DE371